ncbi:MAG: hypothetical protein AB7U20_03630 [Planctomycetaceae bacterium]
MTRRVPKFRSFMQISREQVAVALAAGAVACLSSAIVHWSCRYPVSGKHWEHPLFGELADDIGQPHGPALNPAAANGPPPTDRAERSTAELRDAEFQPFLPVEPHKTIDRPEVSLVEFVQLPGADSTIVPAVAVGTIHRAAWLSGGIEEAVGEPPAPSTGIRPGGRAPAGY